jgi:hypothetical protein
VKQQDHDHVPECGALCGARRGTFVAIFACLPLILWAAGCASTKITEHQVFINERLPRPSHIWVYDFAATAAAVPPDSTLARKFTVEAMPQTAEQIALGQRLGAEIAADLVERMQTMGLPARHATEGETIYVNDLVIRGYIVCVKKGSATARIVIGFGVGGAGLCTIVEGFQMTPHGLRELTFDAVRAGTARTPGASASAAGFLATGNPAGLIVSGSLRVYQEASGYSTVKGRARATAKEIAADLKTLSQEQGWIAG